MKKKIFAVLMAATMTVSMAVTSFAAADTTSNLIGKFTFDENIKNEVTGEEAKVVAQKGLGPDAAAVEYAFPFADGVDGKAIQLNADGNTNGLNLNLKVADSKNFTISVWVKSIGCNFANPIVWMGKAKQSPENWIGIWAGLNGDYKNAPALGSNDTAGHRYGATPNPDEGLGNVKNTENADKATCFDWTNVTIVVEKSIGRIYYDGQLVGTMEGTMADVTDEEGNVTKEQVLLPDVNEDDTVSIYLGANAWDAPFNGYVDDLYIYDRALSTEDVVALVTETNKAGVTLGEFNEVATTIDYTQKPSKFVPQTINEDSEGGISPVVIGVIIGAVVLVVIIAVVVVTKSKKNKKDEEEE